MAIYRRKTTLNIECCNDICSSPSSMTCMLFLFEFFILLFYILSASRLLLCYASILNYESGLLLLVIARHDSRHLQTLGRSNVYEMRHDVALLRGTLTVTFYGTESIFSCAISFCKTIPAALVTSVNRTVSYLHLKTHTHNHPKKQWAL